MTSAPISPAPPSQIGSQDSSRPIPAGSSGPQGNDPSNSPFLQIVASLNSTPILDPTAQPTDSTSSGVDGDFPNLPTQPKVPKQIGNSDSSAALNYQLVIGLLYQPPQPPANDPQPPQSPQSNSLAAPTTAIVQSARSALAATIAAPFVLKELAQAPANDDRQTDASNSAGTAQGTNAEQVSRITGSDLSRLADTQLQLGTDKDVVNVASRLIDSPMASVVDGTVTNSVETNATSATKKETDNTPRREVGRFASLNIVPQSEQPIGIDTWRSNLNSGADRPALPKVANVADSSWLIATAPGSAAGPALSPLDASGSTAVQSNAGAGNSNGAQTASGNPSLVGTISQPRDVTWPEAVHGVTSTALAKIERDEQAEFRFRVSPPDIGEIRIRLTGGPNGVTGEMTVGNSSIQQLVETRLPELRQQLEAAGVSVSSFNVTQQGGSSPDSSRQNSAAWDAEAIEDLRSASFAKRTRAGGLSRGLVDVTA